MTYTIPIPIPKLLGIFKSLRGPESIRLRRSHASFVDLLRRRMGGPTDAGNAWEKVHLALHHNLRSYRTDLQSVPPTPETIALEPVLRTLHRSLFDRSAVCLPAEPHHQPRRPAQPVPDLPCSLDEYAERGWLHPCRLVGWQIDCDLVPGGYPIAGADCGMAAPVICDPAQVASLVIERGAVDWGCLATPDGLWLLAEDRAGQPVGAARLAGCSPLLGADAPPYPTL